MRIEIRCASDFGKFPVAILISLAMAACNGDTLMSQRRGIQDPALLAELFTVHPQPASCLEQLRDGFQGSRVETLNCTQETPAPLQPFGYAWSRPPRIGVLGDADLDKIDRALKELPVSIGGVYRATEQDQHQFDIVISPGVTPLDIKFMGRSPRARLPSDELRHSVAVWLARERMETQELTFYLPPEQAYPDVNLGFVADARGEIEFAACAIPMNFSSSIGEHPMPQTYGVLVLRCIVRCLGVPGGTADEGASLLRAGAAVTESQSSLEATPLDLEILRGLVSSSK